MRRLRRTPLIRELVREVTVSKADLIQPLFVEEALTKNTPISSMPGQIRFSLSSLVREQLNSKIEESDQSSFSVFPATRMMTGPGHATPKELCNSQCRA